MVASADGRDVVRQRKSGRMGDPALFGRQLALQLLPRARTLIGAAAGSR